jgi:hypothetical protein
VKLLLVPLAILAFIVLLIVLGAIGLGVAFAVLSVFGRLGRLVMRGGGGSDRKPAA